MSASARRPIVTDGRLPLSTWMCCAALLVAVDEEPLAERLGGLASLELLLGRVVERER